MSAAGYTAAGTLGVGVELRRQFRRRRTRVAFGFVVGLPLLLILAFSVGAGDAAAGDGRVTLVDVATSGALNFALFVLFATAGFFLVVGYALFFGDSVASEASWGSLRYLLAIPVPRGRLLRQKYVVATVQSISALLVLVVVSVVAGLVAYGWEPVRTPVGNALSPGEASLRLLAIVAYLAVTLLTVGSLAFLLSVLTDAPLAAVGGAVFALIVSSILDSIDALGSVRDYLPTAGQYAWVGMLSQPVDTGDMLHGVIVTLVYSTVFLSLAGWRFGRKDILS